MTMKQVFLFVCVYALTYPSLGQTVSNNLNLSDDTSEEPDVKASDTSVLSDAKVNSEVENPIENSKSPIELNEGTNNESTSEDSHVPSQPQSSPDADLTDNELVSKYGAVEAVESEGESSEGESSEGESSDENVDIGIEKLMEEVESILSKLSDDQDEKLQKLLGHHYAKEYEKRDEMLGKLVKEDEDIKELISLVMVLEDKGAAINLLEEEDD